METFQFLVDGFAVALSWENLLWVMVGVSLGTAIGAMPGVGPTAGMALLLPVAFGMNPTSSLIMLGGIYYGAMYGGTITAVLLNIPGESDAVWTAMEGHKLARRGKAGVALVIAAVASFIAGTTGIIALMFFAPTLATWALDFGPPENFAILFLGLAMVSGLTGNNPAKGYIMMALGLAVAMVGFDIITATPRFTFGNTNLYDGINFVVVGVGMFGITQVLVNLEQHLDFSGLKQRVSLRGVTRQDWREASGPIARGSIMGFAIGIIPGAGTTIGSTISYALERRLTRKPEKFGEGAVEGIAGPESANNAVTNGSMVPMLSLGVPGSPATAILLGAMLLHGLRPGPALFQNSPDIVWPFLASMYIGNVVLVALNTLFIPFFTTILGKVEKFLNPGIAVLSIIGVYSLRNNLFDVWLMLVFGLLGYVLYKFEYPVAPLVLGLVLAPAAEQALRQSLIISGGSPTVFFERPISGVFLSIALLIIVFPVFRSGWQMIRNRRATPVMAPEEAG